MKIGVVSTPIFRVPVVGYSGLEHLAWQQAKGLAAKGHNVVLFAPDGSECPGVTVFPIGPAGQTDEKSAYAKYWPELLKLDVICDNSWQKWPYQLKMEGRLKAPSLAWMHAPVATMINKLPPVEKPCFVCISEDQKLHFEALFGKPAWRCYNGICLETYRSTGVPRTERYLFLGRFSTIKGPDLSIEACIKSGVELDLIGDTSITGEPEFLEKCTRLADDKQIKMVGPVSRGECVWWYSRAKGFTHLNQRFREPFGLAPVEAQACGLPVIAWRYGALPEIVKHGETGFLVDSLDEVVDLLKSDAIHTINRDRCREWASQFSVAAMIDCVEGLCHEAIQTGGW